MTFIVLCLSLSCDSNDSILGLTTMYKSYNRYIKILVRLSWCKKTWNIIRLKIVQYFVRWAINEFDAIVVTRLQCE